MMQILPLVCAARVRAHWAVIQVQPVFALLDGRQGYDARAASCPKQMPY